jgi:hypothetical protein
MSLPKPFSVLVFASILVSAAAAQTLARGRLAGAEDAQAYSDTIRRLRTTRLSVAWKNVALADAVKELRLYAGRSVVFAPAAEARKAEPVSLELTDVTAAAVVRLLQTSAKVRFLFEDGIIFVTTPEDAAQRSLEIRVYDVADLLYQAPDFPGPRMDLNPGKPQEAAEETPSSSRDGSEIVDLLRTLVGPEPWDVPGTSITISKQLLIVRQTPEVHAKIRELVAALAAVL